MSTRISKEQALKCSVVGFKTLVLNVCVTWPQKVEGYQKDGKFDIKEFQKQREFLATWGGKSQFFKKANARTYRKYAATWNLTFTFPSKLVDKLMCGYLDDEGRYRRTSVKEVVEYLGKDGFLDPNKSTKHGRKFRKDEFTGKYRPDYDWTNKYFLREKTWYKLLTLNAYRNWDTYPRDKDDDEYGTYRSRAIDKMKKFYEGQTKSKPERVEKPIKKVEPVQSVAKGWREVVGKLWAHNIEDMIHEIETGRGGWEALDNMKKTLKLSEKVAEEIEREAWQRVKEWKAKRLEMVKQQTPEHEFNDKEKEIIREIGRRLLNDKVNEAQAAYVWKTVGATEELIQKWLVRVREKKAMKEAQRLRELNEVADAPTPSNPDEKKFVEEFAKQEVAPKKEEKKPEPPKVLNDEQLDEFLRDMKQWEERK